MSKPVRTGIFALITIIILFMGWAWLGKIEFKNRGYGVIIRFPDVTGLQVNDPVRIGGVEKGEITAIKYTAQYIEVKADVEYDVVLYSDATAAILDVAMISGTKYVDVDPGTSGIVLAKNAPIKGDASYGIPIAKLGEIGSKIDGLLYSLQSQDLIKSAATTLQNLSTATQQLTQLISANEENLKITTDNAKITMENAKKLTEKMDKIVTDADFVMSNIKSGKGTLGKLTKEDSLYNELNATLVSIKELANDIKANPKRYLKLF
jgi:phospholipid/cholesterol/gamma-HCH transport system substrate-binding protein